MSKQRTLTNQASSTQFALADLYTKQWASLAIIIFSLIVRLILVYEGGQYFFPDERRYFNSQNVARLILEGQGKQAFSALTSRAEHLGFRAAGVIPALVENVFASTSKIPATFFSIFSVLNIFLIWKLSQRAGASQKESFYALLVASFSQVLLYYTRHIFPYDLALFFGLLALYLALSNRPNFITNFACGVSGFLCFITYNGYWLLTVFAMAVAAIKYTKTFSQFIKKSFLIIAGFTLPLGATIFFAQSLRRDLVAGYLDFASTIKHGAFSEGWKFPFVFLGHAENGYIFILGLLSIYAIYIFWRFPKKNIESFGLWVSGTIFIYLCLVIPSTVLHIFVVYGRTARVLVPFIALLAARGLTELENQKRFGEKAVSIVLVILFFQFTWNYWNIASISYPIDLAKKAHEQFPGFQLSADNTYLGKPPVCQINEYVAINFKYIYPTPDPIPQIEGTTLLSVPHPINFIPYQYEGLTPQQREPFRKDIVEMKLLRVNPDVQIVDVFGQPIINCINGNQE